MKSEKCFTIKQIFIGRFSDHHSKTGLFDNLTHSDNSKTRLVRYSDGYCFSFFTLDSKQHSFKYPRIKKFLNDFKTWLTGNFQSHWTWLLLLLQKSRDEVFGKPVPDWFHNREVLTTRRTYVKSFETFWTDWVWILTAPDLCSHFFKANWTLNFLKLSLIWGAWDVFDGSVGVIDDSQFLLNLRQPLNSFHQFLIGHFWSLFSSGADLTLAFEELALNFVSLLDVVFSQFAFFTAWSSTIRHFHGFGNLIVERFWSWF